MSKREAARTYIATCRRMAKKWIRKQIAGINLKYWI